VGGGFAAPGIGADTATLFLSREKGVGIGEKSGSIGEVNGSIGRGGIGFLPVFTVCVSGEVNGLMLDVNGLVEDNGLVTESGLVGESTPVEE
jgi:hypothetical protein